MEMHLRMRRALGRISCFAVALVLVFAAPLLAESPDLSGYSPATLRLIWHDSARDRDVPVKIYYPAKAASPCPVIIFSHGLGGNRDGYSYIGQGWAAHGYISVHVQHLGSDDAVWRGSGISAFSLLTKAAADPRNALDRVADVRFAIDKMLALNSDAASPLNGLIDGHSIGMAGHSFGAWTTLAIVGEKTPRGDSLADARIKAAIAMSAPVPAGARDPEHQFAAIPVPVFHMTGTLDDSPIGETKAAQRRIPYDQSTAPGSGLLILTGANHMTFAGRIGFGRQSGEEKFESLILAGSVAFWDAALRHDSAARAWLYGGGFARLLDAQGTFEHR